MILEPNSSFVSDPDCLCVSAHPIFVFHCGYAFSIIINCASLIFIYVVGVEAEFKTSADSTILP